MIETLIVIRTKNEDRWIKATLDKIFSQKYQNFKIIIVDNYSSDRTLEIIKRYSLKVFKIKKFLPGKALNYPIKKIKSKFVVCLSAHCIPSNNKWLGNLIKPLKQDNKVAAVYGKQMPMFNSNDQNFRDLKIIFGNDRKIQKKDYFFHNANSAIRRSLLIDYPFSNTATNIEDRLWAKTILDLNKKYKIIYEPTAAVFHHHGLHQSNDSKRLNGVIKIMKSIEDENLYPESFLKHNQKIYACIIGKRVKQPSKKYFYTNKSLINHLVKNPLIHKIIVVVNKKFFHQFYKNNNQKIIFIKRTNEIKSLTIREVLKFIYKKFYQIDIDYMMYFNMDYIKRPKNFVDELVDKSLININKNIVYSIEEKTNLIVKNKKKNLILNNFMDSSDHAKNVVLNCLFGLGSIFYFNKLKNLKFNLDEIEPLLINDTNYLDRESKKK